MTYNSDKLLQILGVDETTATNGIVDLVSTQSLTYINSKQDLPDPVSGVITLEDNVTYFIEGTIDLTGDRIVGGQNTVIIGGSSENSKLLSTGLDAGTSLLTSNWTTPIRHISFEHGTVLNLDATGNSDQALDWFGVNFVNCNTVGTIKNYSNVIMLSCAFLSSANLTFDGSIGTIGFDTCIFVNTSGGGTSLILPATLTITRRFRVVYSAFVTTSGQTGISVNASATLPVEGYILDTVNFSGGGTYTTGVDSSDDKALFVNTRGITNTSRLGWMTMSANATETVIDTVNTPVKILGTTVAYSGNEKFSHSNNRLTYDGALSTLFKVEAIVSFSTVNNKNIAIFIYKNGSQIAQSRMLATSDSQGKVQNLITHGVVQLNQTDYIEIWIQNETDSNNVTVEDLNVLVTQPN